LEERRVVTWPDIFGRLAERFGSGSPAPFGYAVIDEAQDVGLGACFVHDPARLPTSTSAFFIHSFSV